MIQLLLSDVLPTRRTLVATVDEMQKYAPSSTPASRSSLAPGEAPSMHPRRSTPSTKRSPPFTRIFGLGNLPLHPYTLLTCEAWHLSSRALIYHTRWAQVELMRSYKAEAPWSNTLSQ